MQSSEGRTAPSNHALSWQTHQAWCAIADLVTLRIKSRHSSNRTDFLELKNTVRVRLYAGLVEIEPKYADIEPVSTRLKPVSG
jgi:hypothetical protein